MVVIGVGLWLVMGIISFFIIAHDEGMKEFGKEEQETLTMCMTCGFIIFLIIIIDFLWMKFVTRMNEILIKMNGQNHET